jgi:hypothetical protein
MCGRRDAMQFGAAEAAPPPGQRTGGFCQLVSGVRPPGGFGFSSTWTAWPFREVFRVSNDARGCTRPRPHRQLHVRVCSLLTRKQTHQ